MSFVPFVMYIGGYNTNAFWENIFTHRKYIITIDFVTIS